MDPKAKTRNVDLIRNVLVKALIEEYADELNEHEEPAVLNKVLAEATPYQLLARRLRVTMPPGRTLAGMVVEHAWLETLRTS
jgi:hypothetical protein